MAALGVTAGADLRVRSVLLREVTAVTGLTLSGCALPDGVTCCRASLRDVDLGGSSLSMLAADGLRTDGKLAVVKATLRDLVRLEDAYIGG